MHIGKQCLVARHPLSSKWTSQKNGESEKGRRGRDEFNYTSECWTIYRPRMYWLAAHCGFHTTIDQRIYTYIHIYMHRHGLCVDERVQVDSSGVILSRERKFESRQHHLRGIDAPCQRHWHAHTRVPTAHLRIQKRSIIPARAHTYLCVHTYTHSSSRRLLPLAAAFFFLPSFLDIFLYLTNVSPRARARVYIFIYCAAAK